MASKSNAIKKSSADSAKKNGAGKPHVSATQRKIRRQQVGMAIFALIVVVAMMLSLVIR
jgi:hypothetical protein